MAMVMTMVMRMMMMVLLPAAEWRRRVKCSPRHRVNCSMTHIGDDDNGRPVRIELLHAGTHAAAHTPKPTQTNTPPSRQASPPRHRSVFVMVVPTSARIFPRGISRRRRLGTLPLCHGPYRCTGASDKPSAAVPLHRVICRSAAHHNLEQHCCGWWC